MDITVKGSSMICPAQDTPKERQWISNVDMAMTTFHVPLLYFYRPNASSDFFKAEVLKEALSKILVQFYPMAGRLGSDENGRLQLICNAEGVLFVEAETTCAIDDLGDFVPSLKLRQLVPTVDYSGDMSSYPLVMAQGIHVISHKSLGFFVSLLLLLLSFWLFFRYKISKYNSI
ncbi:hypothetical protein DITRI_Ditri10aG0128100 [Diplodiscus trichospermus]